MKNACTFTAETFLAKYPKAPERSNCLENIACPNCGQRDNFSVQITTMSDLGDDGTGDDGDHEWDENSPMICKRCHHQGVVSQFTVRGLDDLIRERAEATK